MTPDVVDIRQLDARAFDALLATETRAWANDLRWDYTPSAQLISTCLAEKRLSGYALLSAGRIAGYSFFVSDGEKGLIGDLYVERSAGRDEHARLLLEHVLETLMATPGVERIEAQLPHFTRQELDHCFRAHAFAVYVRRFMVLPLASPPGRNPAAAEASGEAAPVRDSAGLRRHGSDFLIEPWERRHDDAIAQLLFATYRGHIDAVINDQYASEAGTTRLIENIVHLRGCGERIPRASLVAIHRPTRTLAAVVALTAVRSDTGHIPQVAVDRNFQGLGLGTFLMESAFKQAAGQGYREVTLTVTDLNEGAVRLYERMGFETFRTFGAFVWNRDASAK